MISFSAICYPRIHAHADSSNPVLPEASRHLVWSGRGWNEGGGAPPWWEDLPEWIEVKNLHVCDYIASVAAQSADFIVAESKKPDEERSEWPGGGDWNGQSVSNMLNGIARCWEVGWISRDALESAFAAMSRIVLGIEIYMFEGVYDSQNVAIIANALARCDYKDEKLMNHLALVVQQVRNFGAQNLGFRVSAPCDRHASGDGIWPLAGTRR